MMADEDATAIACSLPTADLNDRRRTWQAVTDGAMRTKVAIPGGVRLTFEPDHATAHRLLDLVAAERACCAWASWNLTAAANVTLVEVTADEHGAATLQTMFEVTP